jgi:sugar lactone lactonase YvrE
MGIALTRRAVIAGTTGIALAPARAAAGRIATLVGSGAQGVARDGAPALAARLDQPYGVLASGGWLYWADFGSNRVLRLERRSGRIRVVAGTGGKGHAGDGGPARAALLSAPHEVRLDRAGDLLVAERDAHVIRRIAARGGIISTLVGTGTPGFSGDGGPADQAQLNQPHSIALDRRDTLYICDIRNNRVRRRDPATGILTTFAGNGEKADTPESAPLTAPLNGPRSIDIAPDGTLYLVLREGNKIYAIDPRAGRMTHIAGTGEKGYSGDGGPARDATWNGPKGIAWAPGRLYVADTENHAIRMISLSDGIVTTVAGTGRRGDGPDGDALACALARPHGLNAHGNQLFIGDAENHRIRVLEI